MRVADRLAALILAAFLAACADSASPSAPSLSGNFEGVLLTGGEPWYLGLTLTETAGTVTGKGVLSVYARYQAQATGSLTGEQIELVVSPSGPGLTYQFSGTLRGNTIVGSFVPGAGLGLPFEMMRVDTVATGRADLSLSLATIREEHGSAYFQYLLSPTPRIFIGLESLGAERYFQLAVYWDGLNYPRAGAHQVGAPGGPGIYAVEVNNGSIIREFAVEDGTIVLDRARRFALIGSLDIVARDTEGRRTRVRGNFSAGCVGPYC